MNTNSVTAKACSRPPSSERMNGFREGGWGHTRVGWGTGGYHKIRGFREGGWGHTRVGWGASGYQKIRRFREGGWGHTRGLGSHVSATELWMVEHFLTIQGAARALSYILN
jgi:hypothetical protein